MGEAIRLTEISLPEGSEIPGLTEETDQMVVSINEPRAVEEDPEITEESDDGEVIDGEEATKEESTEDADTAEGSEEEAS